jgi:hypothetical protein
LRDRITEKIRKLIKMRQESAQVIALQALAWLAADDEVFAAFLNATGATAAEIKDRAGDADFLGSILDFLLMDDKWVMQFCDFAGLGYSEPLAARAALPGGEAVNWT